MAMERVTVEQNGERFTLEVPEGTTDAEIQSYLSEQQGQVPSAPKSTQPSNVDVGDVAMLATPAVAAVAPYLPGVASSAYQTGKALSTPAASAAYELGKTYLTKPGALVTDIAMSSMGLPPPVAAEQSYKGAKGTYDVAKDFISKQGQFAPKVTTPPPVTPVVPEGITPGVANDMMAASRNMTPEQKLEMLRTGKLPGGAVPATEVAPAAESVAGQIGSRLAPIAQRVAPLLKGASKLLTPAAIASELYYTSPEEQAQLKEMSRTGTTLKDWTKQKLGITKPQVVPQESEQDRLNKMIREAAAKKALAFPGQ